MYSKLAVAAVLIVAAAVGVMAEEYNCNAEGRVCQNGGICKDIVQLQNGNIPGSGGNGWVTPKCICNAPFGGDYCDYTIRECKDSPCKNGGTCSPSDCRAVGSGAFQTYDCFTCTCPKGWKGAPAYTYGGSPNPNGVCDWPVVINDCTVNTCENGGTCTSGGDTSYSCACVTGWLGGNSGGATAINCTVATCANTNGQGACQNGGTCTAGTCQCGEYSGMRCEIPRFCDVNTCPSGATCVNGAGSTGSCQLLPWCTTNSCQNGGTCVNTGAAGAGTGYCNCLAAFDGLYCNTTAFCSVAGNTCQNGGTCVNGARYPAAGATPGGGQGECGCLKGWAGVFCEKPIDGCGRDGVGCAPNSGGCQCTDKTSCRSSNWNMRCECGGGTGGKIYYDCRCNSTSISKCPGMSGASAGVNLDMVCQNGGQCVESAEGTACSCRQGFWGDKCQNYDNPCMNAPCQNGGQCYMASETQGVPLDDRYWGYRCRCKWPYYGKNCENTAPISTDGRDPVVCGAGNSPCQNGGTCGLRSWDRSFGNYITSNGMSGSLEYAGPYRCTCPQANAVQYGYWGMNCENQIERCSVDTCKNGGFCQNNGISVSCTCPCGYAGDRCELKAGNVQPASVAQFAGDGAGGVGYHLDFCSQEPCLNGGTCATTVDGQSFQCGCTSGWAGTYCQYRVLSAAAGVVPSIMAVAAAVAVAFAMKH